MKVTIKLKHGRCMTIKIMNESDYSHSGVRPFAHRARSRENYVTTGNGLKNGVHSGL